jgi:ribonuclease HI
MKLTINIDGGSRGNPGPAAYGCYLQPEGEPVIELKGKLGRTTNNVAEYHGLIRALEKAIELGADDVHIRADSELLVRQMTGAYRVKNSNIIPLYQAAQSLIKRLGNVRFQHVYREQNSQADRLCNEALDDPYLPVEKLGLRFLEAVEKKQKKKLQQESSPDLEPGEAEGDYAKVKLVGTLLSMVSLGRAKQYAVAVNGTTWKLDLAALPFSIKPGTRVAILGELLMHKSTPMVKVKKIKKA